MNNKDTVASFEKFYSALGLNNWNSADLEYKVRKLKFIRDYFGLKEEEFCEIGVSVSSDLYPKFSKLFSDVTVVKKAEWLENGKYIFFQPIKLEPEISNPYSFAEAMIIGWKDLMKEVNPDKTI